MAALLPVSALDYFLSVWFSNDKNIDIVVQGIQTSFILDPIKRLPLPSPVAICLLFLCVWLCVHLI